jgi:chitinase
MTQGNRRRNSHILRHAVCWAGGSALLTILSLGGCGPVGFEEDEFAPEFVDIEQAASAKRVVAYAFPDGNLDGWNPTNGCANVNLSRYAPTKYTHVNYAFMHLDENGNVYQPYDCYQTQLPELKKLKNSNSSLKLLVSWGGWTWSDNFSTVTGDSTKRSRFVNQAWDFVNNNGLDGVDIDWEWPGWQGEGDNSVCAGSCDGERLEQLLKDLWNSSKRGSKLVTIAGSANPQFCQYVDCDNTTNGIGPYLSYATVMTYDFAWAAQQGHHAKLYGTCTPYSSTCSDFSVENAVKMYTSAGFPANKLAIGVPFYGRAWGIWPHEHPYTNELKNCSTSNGSTCTVGGVSMTLKTYSAQGKSSAKYLEGGGAMVSFDNITSIGWKTAYANNNNLGGIMYWHAIQDDINHSRSLTNKIYNDIIGGSSCTPATCGSSCGIISDGCGGTLDCGSCGGTGTFNGRYRLKAVHSSKCVDVEGGTSATANGANVHQWSCHTNDNQKWDITHCGSGVHILKAVHSGKFMNVYGGSDGPCCNDDGANIQQWGSYTCSSTAQNVKFKFIDKGAGKYQLQAQSSGKCVDVSGGVSAIENGRNIHQWSCHENDNQRFWLEPM